MATAAKRTRPKMNLTGPSDPPKSVGKHDQGISGSSQEPGKPGPSTNPKNTVQMQGTETSVSSNPRQASRIGKRAVTFYVGNDAFRQLGVLSAQTDRTVQDLMQEALDWQFQQHDMHRIAKQ